jgi:hypothetical protein
MPSPVLHRAGLTAVHGMEASTTVPAARNQALAGGVDTAGRIVDEAKMDVCSTLCKIIEDELVKSDLITMQELNATPGATYLFGQLALDSVDVLIVSNDESGALLSVNEQATEGTGDTNALE